MATPSDQELRREFGHDAIFSRVRDITIVHLDHPTGAMIQKRIEEVKKEASEPDDCALCEMERVKGGYTVVYDKESVWQYSKVQPWVN